MLNDVTTWAPTRQLSSFSAPAPKSSCYSVVIAYTCVVGRQQWLDLQWICQERNAQGQERKTSARKDVRTVTCNKDTHADLLSCVKSC
jgi:hypothetical protein